MKYKVDMPYPEVKVKNKDLELAKQIFNVYAGEVSEDTCTHSYILQKFLFSDNEEIKQIFHGIAIVEMHHLEILGELIKKLGLIPLYLSVKNNNVEWFSGKYVASEKNIKDALLKNINMEKLAIKSYENIIQSTNDENIIHIMKRIILDERLHIEIFEKIYNQL